MTTPLRSAGPWAQACHDTRRGEKATYDVWIVSVQPAHEAALRARIGAMIGSMVGRDGSAPRWVIVPEQAERPGNLVGTLLTWRHACDLAQQQGWDLDGAWRAGDRVVLVHAAGKGRRAAPLVHCEDGDRSALWLPGTLGSGPARLLEAVMTQIAPLARSQSPDFLDVIWASQLFLPTVAPDQVPPPRAPLTKLGTGLTALSSDAKADVGVFLVDADAPRRFIPQGTPMPPLDGLRPIADLGSFRLRRDLLAVLMETYLDPLPSGPRDLDPHLTAPLLGAQGPTRAEAEAVRAALGVDAVVDVTDLGLGLPWWRLRRPAELRALAMATLPSANTPDLHVLLGIDHPICRSWLGDVWVEGPEITWAAVREGIHIGGVFVRDSIVQDSGVWPWPDGWRTPVGAPSIIGCVLQGATGGLDLEDAWLVGTGGPGWRGGGGLAWRVTGEAPAGAGPSPTSEGICTVRRPRLRDGELVCYGFLHGAGGGVRAPSPREIERMPIPRGPRLDHRHPSSLDDVAPHKIIAPPLVALALLRERLPPRSDLLRLLELMEDGRFEIALHRGCRPTRALDSGLVPGRRFTSADAYRLHGDLESWERLKWSPPRIAEALLEAMLLHFIPSGNAGRQAFTERRLRAFRHGPIEADGELASFLEQRVLDADAGSVLDAVWAWSFAEDPDRTDLAAMLDALDVLAPTAQALRTPSHLRAWCRWQLERAGQTAMVITERLAAAPRALLDKTGFVWRHPWVEQGRRLWVPRLDLRPTRVPDRRRASSEMVRDLVGRVTSRLSEGQTPILGICGPAAAGKSSLAVQIAEALDGSDHRVAYLGTDSFCWQGDGFRYEQMERVRHTRLYGPGIVDEVGLLEAVLAARESHDCVVVEGVYVGRDPALRAELDWLVAVLLDDRTRLDMKYGRDTLRGRRRIDVVTDFADKVHHENQDGVMPILQFASRIWDRGTGECWDR